MTELGTKAETLVAFPVYRYLCLKGGRAELLRDSRLGQT